MHGRLKVKTTTQQQAEKAAERQQKAKAYQKAMQGIFGLRAMGTAQAGVAGLQQQLKATSAVLMNNPDISTLWNIRREVWLEMQRLRAEQEQKQESEAASAEKSEEAVTAAAAAPDLDELLEQELELTQQCLMANPKSYGAWHHRSWCLDHLSKPNWAREVALCNKYLSLDERNFHCWDHRRFVVRRAQVPPAQELDFTMDLINTNFSNYSAWHQRSKLLPQVYPAPDQRLGIMEEKQREEIDLVQNAAFTDPEDSSAWFYHTWILGQQRRSGYVAAILQESKLSLVLGRPVGRDAIKMAGKEVVWEAEPGTGGGNLAKIWSAAVDLGEGGEEVALTLDGEEYRFAAHAKAADLPHCQVLSRPDEQPSSHSSMGPETRAVLELDMKNCQELLQLEPDSKWTGLSAVLVQRALGEDGHFDALQSVDKLRSVDPLRAGFYRDLRSKLVVEQRLASSSSSSSSLSVDLSKQDLSSVYYPEQLSHAVRLDLSGNQLRSVAGVLPYLLLCQELRLDDNRLESLPVDRVESMNNLRLLSLKGNPLCDNAEQVSQIRNLLPNVELVL